jgi:Ca2+-binding RTX toxin-like protein
MAVQVSNIRIDSVITAADVFTGDDTYAKINDFFNGSPQEVFNFNEGGLASKGHPFSVGQHGIVTTSDGRFIFSINSSSSVTISLFDQDGTAFDDLLAAPDDPLGSTTYFVTGNEKGTKTVSAEVSGSGSDYGVTFDVTALAPPTLKPRHPSGKVADSEGGLMQGSNTAGTLIGQGGKDIIFGNKGDDIIVGGGNDDVLNGGKGDDIIFGGKGNDTLSGGAGNDIFVIAPNNGFDIIKDFHQGDLLGLDKSLQFKDLTLVNQAKGTLVKAGNEKLTFLQGVHQLSGSDFTQVDLSNLNSRVHNDFPALSKAA